MSIPSVPLSDEQQQQDYYTIPWPGKLNVVMALTSFMVMSGFSPLAIVLLIASLIISLGTTNRINIPRTMMYVLCIIPALVLYFIPDPRPEQSYFVGPGSFKVSFFLSFFLLLLLLKRGSKQVGYAILALSILTTLLCGITFFTYPYVYLIPFFTTSVILFCRSLTDLPPLKLNVLLSLLFTGLLLAALLLLFKWSERQVNSLALLLNPALTPTASFSNRATLRSIASAQQNNAVLIRIIGIYPSKYQPPTYLAAKRYALFDGTSWFSPEKTSLHSPVKEADLSPTSPSLKSKLPNNPSWETFILIPSTFLSLPNPNPIQSFYFVEKIMVSNYKDMTPLPTSSSAILLSAPLANIAKDSENIVYLPSAADFKGVYYQVRNPKIHSFPNKKRLDKYLQLPKNTPPILKRLAQEITAKHPTALSKAVALENYFHREHKYGFGYPFDPHRNPLEQFLQEKPPAHCEFFASAMALMLRSIGVPSRYVNGFMVKNYNFLGRYWTVRGSDAHAWVEAYIPNAGWITFDPTPPDSTPKTSTYRRLWNNLSDALSFYYHQLLDRPLQGLGNLFSYLTKLIVSAYQHPQSLFYLVLILIAAFLIRKSKIALPLWSWLKEEKNINLEDQKLLELLARFERQFKSQHLTRSSHMTLREWEKSVTECITSPQESTLITEFIDTYYEARYRECSPEIIQRLEELLRRSGNQNLT